MRYFKLSAFDGPMPAGYPLKLGSIIRVRRVNQIQRTPVWDSGTNCWTTPVWEETTDPSASEVSA